MLRPNSLAAAHWAGQGSSPSRLQSCRNSMASFMSASSYQGKEREGVPVLDFGIEGAVAAVDHDDADLFFGQAQIEHHAAAEGPFGEGFLLHLEPAVSECGEKLQGYLHG